MENTVKSLMCILRSLIENKELNLQLSKDVTEKLFILSEKHDISHLVGYVLQKNNLLVDGEIAEKFNKSIYKAIYRYERNNYDFNRVCQCFEENKIPFIPLKGAVIRDYYPEPWLRTSSDIDILIHEYDLEKACDILKQKFQFQSGGKCEHDVSFKSPSGVHLELHYKLIPENNDSQPMDINCEVWERSYAVNGKVYHHIMSDEMFYFYHISHMYKHFKSGGCGVRTFLDTYLLNKVSAARDVNRQLLSKSGLYGFENAVYEMCEVWFNNKEYTPKTEKTEEYIISGGIYGSIKNKAKVNRITVKDEKSVLSKLWKPYEELKFWYPNLKRFKILLPYYEIKRWCRIAFGDVLKFTVKEKRLTKKVKENEIADIRDLFEKLDIK